MGFASGLSARINALVYEGAAADPVAFELHRSIIAARLAMGVLVLAAAPIYLTISEGPPPSAVVCFFWLLAPLLAAALLSRRGRLAECQAVTAASFIGLGVTLGLAGGPAAPAAFAFLALAPLELVFALDRRLVLAAGGAAACAAAVLATCGSFADATAGLAGSVLLLALVCGVIVYAADVAFRILRLIRRREQMQRLGAAKLTGLSDALGDLVMHHDRSGAVLWASDEAQSLFGLAQRDVMGRGFFERVHVADRPAFLTCIFDAAQSERTVSATLRLRIAAEGREDLVFAWVELRARRQVGGASQAEAEAEVEVVSVVRDVTATKRHEREIEEARLDAERASAWKDRFLANVSHELRTPLNSIIGFSDMLCSEELAPHDPAKRREYAQIISSSGQHLLSVVNSILDMSKIEAGRFDIMFEPFELGPLIESCCDMVRLKAEQGDVQIVRACAPDLPELVADKRACKQILINLLSNAVKFTPRGGRVTVGARAEGNSIVLSVSDTGIGIAACDIAKVGTAFFQVRAAYDRPFEGTGLGLSVVRGLVGLHAGAITLDSAPGEGTCVAVRLPRDGRSAQTVAVPARIEVVPQAARAAASCASLPVSLAMVKKIA